MLKTSPRLKIILEATNIIYSKRQPRNLDRGKYIHLQNNKSRIQSETQLGVQQQVCSIRVDMCGMWGELY